MKFLTTNLARITQHSESMLWLFLLIVSSPILLSWQQELFGKSLDELWLPILVLPVLGFGLYKRLKDETFILKPSYAGLFALGLSSLLLAGSEFFSIRSVYWLSFLPLSASFVWALYGWERFKNYAPCFLFGVFLLPVVHAEIINLISLPLQLLSTELTAWFAQWILPVGHNGFYIQVQDQLFEITPACSGIHSWGGFLFSILLWHVLDGGSFKRLLVLLFCTPFISITINVIRLLLTLLMAFHISMDFSISVHSNLDFLLFPLGLFMLWLIGRRL